MQTIRIVISEGKARSVEISDAPKRTPPKKSVPTLLRLMPKALLAKAFTIQPGKGGTSDV